MNNGNFENLFEIEMSSDSFTKKYLFNQKKTVLKKSHYIDIL